MDPEHGKSSDGYHTSQQVMRLHDSTATLDNDLLKLGSGSKAQENESCSSSTTSEDSSEDDFFQLDASQLNKSIATDERGSNSIPSIQVENVPKEAGFGFSDKQKVRNPNEDEGIIAGSMWSNKVPTGSTDSPGLFGGSSKSDTSMLGVKQSPPVQTMLRPDVPDPKRIPSSVFARTKSNTPMEWSVASNESLFSIHMGKSGDLTGLYNNQFENHPSISPTASPGQVQFVGIGSGLQPQVSTETAKDVSRISQVQPEKEKPSLEGIPHSDSTPRLSDSSVNSYRSFAFPILTPDGRNTSVKAESMHQQEKKEPPQQSPPAVEPPIADPVAPQSKWFPCFSCCSFCC